MSSPHVAIMIIATNCVKIVLFSWGIVHVVETGLQTQNSYTTIATSQGQSESQSSTTKVMLEVRRISSPLLTNTNLHNSKILHRVILNTASYMLVIKILESQTYRSRSCVVVANKPSGISVSMLSKRVLPGNGDQWGKTIWIRYQGILVCTLFSWQCPPHM